MKRTDAAIKKEPGSAVEAKDASIFGACKYKRIGTSDGWTIIDMSREEDELVAMLPAQPAAGKLLYLITLRKGRYHIV